VGNQGYGGSEERGQELVLGGKLGGGLVGEESGDGDADESVQGVPDEVEGGDFVGEELDDEERGAGDDDRPSVEQLQSRRQREMAEAGQQAEDGDGGVEVQSGGESDGGQQGEQFRGRDFEDVEHALGTRVSREGDHATQREAGSSPVLTDRFGMTTLRSGFCKPPAFN